MREVALDHATLLINHAKRHGGFTINAMTFELVEHNSGFMVSSATGEVTVDLPNMTEEFAGNSVADMIEGLSVIIEESAVDQDSWFIGGWIEGDSLVIDASEHIYGLERAVITGKARTQRAIFDCSRNQVVHLSGKKAS